jgi:hypothetical protein
MNMKNLTPESYLCMGGLGCPAVYATDDGTYILIGKRLRTDDPRFGLVANKAADEEIIEIPADLLNKLKAILR